MTLAEGIAALKFVADFLLMTSTPGSIHSDKTFFVKKMTEGSKDRKRSSLKPTVSVIGSHKIRDNGYSQLRYTDT